MFIYPNPVGATLSFDWTGAGPLFIQLYDVLGRVVKSESPAATGRIQLDMADLASGVYICKLHDPNSGELLAEGKVVKE